MTKITDWTPQEMINFQINMTVGEIAFELKQKLDSVDWSMMDRRTAQALRELDLALHRADLVSRRFPQSDRQKE